jgi:glucose-6-phosphate isomerase
MRLSLLTLAGLLAAAPAFADDKAACQDGIAMIRDALAKNPSEASLPKLKKALRVAEREQGEGEYDECLDAVGDAKRAMTK